MNRRRMLASLCVLAVVTGALALAQRGQSVRPPALPSQLAVLPDHITYKHLFHHVVAFRKQAEENERDGKDGTVLRTFFKRKAQLSDEQAGILDQIASDCDQEIKLEDAKAKALVDAYRAQYPDGKVPHGETPKRPPAELHVLTQERNAIILRARDRLHAALGDDEFRRFDNFVKRNVAPNVTRTSAGQTPSAP